MEAILRIINNRITDYDLTTEKDRIFADGFYTFPQGNTWIFQSDKVILQNGWQVTYGMLQVGDVLVLDSTSRQAIMVLPKVQGVMKKLLFSQSMTIGRYTDNRVELQNRNVSGHHCRFYVENNRIYLEDTGSTNGTYVNDIIVLPGRGVVLSQGDVVKIDRYIFQYRDALYITNADGTVVIHTDGTRSADGGEGNQNANSEKPVPPDRVEKAWKEYPRFSRAPRQLNVLRPLTIDILSAPQIGEKQGMGIPGIGLNMTTMAVSLRMQALRYAMNRRKRRSNPAMPVMPFLILIVDEYADFKTQYPEFTAPIDHLYQAGRSLGVFAILMTQKPSGKITDQMRANLGFRWCLRVDDESGSREVLGNPDAAHLRGAGRAYVKANDGTYELIQSFYSSAPYRPDRGGKETNAQVFALRLNGTVLHRDTQAEPERKESRTELEVITAYVTEYCKRQHIEGARPMWQQAFPDCVELKGLLERYRDKSVAAETDEDESRVRLPFWDWRMTPSISFRICSCTISGIREVWQFMACPFQGKLHFYRHWCFPCATAIPPGRYNFTS